jgi:hypothetical protein
MYCQSQQVIVFWPKQPSPGMNVHNAFHLVLKYVHLSLVMVYRPKRVALLNAIHVLLVTVNSNDIMDLLKCTKI